MKDPTATPMMSLSSSFKNKKLKNFSFKFFLRPAFLVLDLGLDVLNSVGYINLDKLSQKSNGGAPVLVLTCYRSLTQIIGEFAELRK